MRLETDNLLKWLIIFAAVTYLPVFGFYYVGEEAIHPIVSLEMLFNNDWMHQVIYGSALQHNPLFNWLIMVLSMAVGLKHVLLVTRFIAIASTLGSASVLFWLTARFSKDRVFGLFAALSYLTFLDVSLYHGWLAYVDPLYSLFVFASIALLWVAIDEESYPLLALSAVALSLAFLTKAFTAYVFYGLSLLVLMARVKKCRRFVFSWPTLIVACITLIAPIVWFLMISGETGNASAMSSDILRKFSIPSAGSYLEHLVGFPLEAFLRMTPVSLLVMYAFFRNKLVKQEANGRNDASVAFWMALVNLLPYWFAPQSEIRYVMPVYPLFAYSLAALLWRMRNPGIAIKWMAGFLILKLIVLSVLFPWYQSHYRGKNYLNVARQIAKETEGFPLYVTDVSSSGLSVTGYLDVLRLGKPPLIFPPGKWQNGFAIAYAGNPEIGKIYKTYKLGGDTLYLLCRGDACNSSGRIE